MKVCSKCVLSDLDNCFISFDYNGVCNYCNTYMKNEPEFNKLQNNLSEKIAEIKKSGIGKKYDCVIGVSGGVDSSYIALLAKKYNLRCLAVHLDNGWNSELAVQNIDSIINKCNFDLYTHVINWEEFKSLQISFLKAGVIDIEVLTDHAISAIIYRLADSFSIQYILSGHNITTEGILPEDWHYRKGDSKNIESIYRMFNKQKLKSYPFMTIYRRAYFEVFSKIESISLLNYITYDKEQAKREIIEEFGWRDYGGKHHESIFTKFYQAYILPTKFGVDKRKAHLSSLINSNQIGREDALIELQKPLYPEHELKRDMEFVLKKLDLTQIEFDALMQEKPVPHTNYTTDLFETKVYYYLKSKFKKLV